MFGWAWLEAFCLEALQLGGPWEAPGFGGPEKPRSAAGPQGLGA